MSMNVESGRKPSFYARQLHLSGIQASEGVTPEDLAADKAELAAVTLPPLEFLTDEKRPAAAPVRKGFGRYLDTLVHTYGGILGAAAMALLVVVPVLTMRTGDLPSGPADTVRVKGGEKVVLYVERNGVVSQHAAGGPLQNGDRLRTEVLSAGERVAFQFVSSGDRRVLSSIADVLNERIYIRPGDKGVFPGSIELVGRSEGETLNVLICDGQVASATVVEFIKEFPADGSGDAPKGCLLKSIGLR